MAKLTILGSGTSTGIPMLGCKCEACTSTDEKDFRLRSSIMIEENGTRIIVDATPEFRLQCLKHKVDMIDALFITHDHADHINGLDDIRSFTIHSKKPMPVYADKRTGEVIRERFAYIFRKENPAGVSLPKIDLQEIKTPMKIGAITVEPLKVFHGTQEILGYKFGKLAYVTDVNEIPNGTFEKLYGLEILILDAVRFKPHPTHFSVEEAINIIKELKPQQAFLTHLNHNIMHERDSKNLPENIAFAYDGLSCDFNC